MNRLFLALACVSIAGCMTQDVDEPPRTATNSVEDNVSCQTKCYNTDDARSCRSGLRIGDTDRPTCEKLDTCLRACVGGRR